MEGVSPLEGKFYTKLWFILCMCVLMPPFGIFLTLFFKNPAVMKWRLICVGLTLVHWAIWLYIAYFSPLQIA